MTKLERVFSLRRKMILMRWSFLLIKKLVKIRLMSLNALRIFIYDHFSKRIFWKFRHFISLILILASLV